MDWSRIEALESDERLIPLLKYPFNILKMKVQFEPSIARFSVWIADGDFHHLYPEPDNTGA